MKPKYNDEKHCPLCGSENTDDVDAYNDGFNHVIECECLDCGATWITKYDLVFAGNFHIKEKAGNEYDDMPVEKEA